MDKKKLQLGMNPATAAHRLRKNILFKFAVDAGHKCYQCGKPLTDDNFSVEHIKPWLDSDDPVGLFFDLDNIAFSHFTCNSGAARRTTKTYSNEKDRLAKDAARSKVYRDSLPKEVKQARRRARYMQHGY